ncbi:hypothetical protein, partial [Paraburkholderia megapolitana]|uniref:hypothetical protein n=1 Tax=Paraburkholderia megapolitana TaxID=420953 RepID=UPI001C434355
QHRKGAKSYMAVAFDPGQKGKTRNTPLGTTDVANLYYVKFVVQAAPSAASSQGNLFRNTASTGSKLENPESPASRRLQPAGVFFGPRSYDKPADAAHRAYRDACSGYASTGFEFLPPRQPTRQQTPLHAAKAQAESRNLPDRLKSGKTSPKQQN